MSLFYNGGVPVHPSGVPVHPGPDTIMLRCLPVLKMLATGVNLDGIGVKDISTGLNRDATGMNRNATGANRGLPWPNP